MGTALRLKLLDLGKRNMLRKLHFQHNSFLRSFYENQVENEGNGYQNLTERLITNS